MQLEALSRARGNLSTANYETIFREFSARGIPETEIDPRENVLTFHAWKALNRHVRRGEKGVAVCSWIPTTKRERDPSTGEEKETSGTRPVTAYVFHVSQTDPND